MTLLVRSLTLVAVSLLPAIALQATHELDTRQTREQELRRDAQHNARLAAAELKQLIGGVR